jgi:hypothetical protein
MQHQDRPSDWVRRDDRAPPLWLVALAIGVQMMAFGVVLAQSHDAWLTRPLAQVLYRYDLMLCGDDQACAARAGGRLLLKESVSR